MRRCLYPRIQIKDTLITILIIYKLIKKRSAKDAVHSECEKLKVKKYERKMQVYA